MVSRRNFSLSGRLPALRADITERLEHFGAFERTAGGTAQRVVSQPHELPVKDRILAQTADGHGHTVLQLTLAVNLRAIRLGKVVQELFGRAGQLQLLGTTGGYIVGFLVSALLMWAMEALFGSKKWVLPASMVVGLIACYALGTAWFMVVYTGSKGAITLGAVLGMCVIPYIIPDAVKIAVALLLTKALKRFVK